jgi:hypothetical protein
MYIGGSEWKVTGYMWGRLNCCRLFRQQQKVEEACTLVSEHIATMNDRIGQSCMGVYRLERQLAVVNALAIKKGWSSAMRLVADDITARIAENEKDIRDQNTRRRMLERQLRLLEAGIENNGVVQILRESARLFKFHPDVVSFDDACVTMDAARDMAEEVLATSEMLFEDDEEVVNSELAIDLPDAPESRMNSSSIGMQSFPKAQNAIGACTERPERGCCEEFRTSDT